MLRIIRNCSRWATRKLDIVAYLSAENLALRQQLIVLKRTQNRPKLKERDRLFWVARRPSDCAAGYPHTLE